MVVGVDGAGRTHRLDAIAAAGELPVARFVAPTTGAEPDLPDPPAEADGSPGLLLVDDAHRLDGASLRALAGAARSGRPIVIARRPTIDRPELAELDEAVAAGGRVEVLAALDRDQVGALVTRITGRPCTEETATQVWEASGGLPAVATAVASALDRGQPAGPPPGLMARLQRRLAVLAPEQAQAARILALRLDLPDDVLARACGVDLPELAGLLRALRDEGLLVPDTERMIPAVGQALLADLPPGPRRRLHDEVARALVDCGAPALLAATQLRAARARGADAAAAYLAAGERTRFEDPAAALGWFDDAVDAGADPAAAAPGQAEAGALLGLPVDPDAAADDAQAAARMALVAGAAQAHQGRSERAARTLLDAAGAGPALAATALVATGQLGAARDAVRAGAASRSATALSIRLLSEAAVAATDPSDALPLAIEAAEAAERTPPVTVLPDTPHALGAVLAVMTGDLTTAEHLLDRALATGVGGPVAADRHRLLLAWARLRAGHPDTAAEQVRRLAGAELNGRDRMVHAALVSGLARRTGDIAALRESWAAVERVLARRSLDLFQLEAAEELAVAAARLRRQPRSAPTLAGFEQIVQSLGSPPAWVISLGWLHLQVAVAADDPDAAAIAAQRISAAQAPTERQQAQQRAAACWAAALAGQVDADAVLDATEALAGAQLPWEASRLAGDAAIRVPDAGAARRLLERARELAAPEPARTADPAQQAGLSEREVEVARLVLAGRTHREIGAQLYIAPKTVEHHVARIRTKLGASTRAEFVAALHGLLDGGIAPPGSPS